jgi:hypothetical protein
MNPFELAARAVYVIAKVVNYCSREENDGSDLPSRIERADQLQAMLDEWQRYLTTEFTPLPFKSANPQTEAFEPVWIHPAPFGKSTLSERRVLFFDNLFSCCSPTTLFSPLTPTSQQTIERRLWWISGTE